LDLHQDYTATGGVISDYTAPGSNVYEHTFLHHQELLVVSALGTYPATVEYLVVAGGGGVQELISWGWCWRISFFCYRRKFWWWSKC
jgi:hypothetical protein